MPMPIDLRQIAATIAPLRGWDFSRMDVDRDPVPWVYEEVVRRFMRPADRVLDVGTGGGERFLSLADAFGSGLGTDIDPEMIRVARKNTPPALGNRVAFEVMPAAALTVEDASFDVLLNRHAPFSAKEVARVLRPGGYFVTQQVGRRNVQNIFEAFGWASSGAYWDEQRRPAGLDPYLIDNDAEALRAMGCDVVARGTYDVGYYVRDVPSLLFWLQSQPLPEPFDIERHEPLVRSLIERYWTPRGFASNEHSDLLVVRKREDH